MPQDNTLGAPTEGLGQKVTFAFNTPQGLPQLDAGGTSGMRAGVQGGGTRGAGSTKASGVKLQANPTMELIMAVADPILKRDMQQRKTEAYLNGMQRAMNGEAVADIAETQPWYSNIFGESDVVEGARAYTGHTVAQTTVSAMEDQMPEIRKMSPKEAQAYYAKTVQGQMTGDAATDMTIMRSLTQALPAVMRRQSKEHYGYLQENAARSEAEAFQAGAKRLQAGASGLSKGYTTPEEYAGTVEAFVQSIVPAPGRDIKNYKESMSDNLAGWAANGNFHALNALKDRGFLDVLDADQRTKVDKAIEAGESKLRSKYSFDWNDQLAQVESQAKMPGVGQTTEIASQIDVLNKRYQDETGSRQGLITPDHRAALVSGSAIFIAQEKNRQADKAEANRVKAVTKQDKEAAQASKNEIIRQRAMEGSLGTLVANKAYGKEDINEVAEPIYRAMKSEDQVKFLVNNTNENYVIDPIKNYRIGQVKGALTSENVDDFMPAFEEYKKLRDTNAFAADAYYGDMSTRLDGFYNDMKNGVAPAGAFRARFIGPSSRAKLDKEDMKKAVDVVNSDYNSWAPEWMGGQKLKPGNATRITNEIADLVEQFTGAGTDTKAATARALRVKKQNGLDVVGGFAWQRNKNQTSVTSFLTHNVGPANEAPIATDKINDHFAMAVDELLFGEADTAGIGADSSSDVAVFQIDDKAGVPQFHVQAVHDGEVKNGLLSANDVYTLSRKRMDRNAKYREQGLLTNKGFLPPALPPKSKPSDYDMPRPSGGLIDKLL